MALRHLTPILASLLLPCALLLGGCGAPKRHVAAPTEYDWSDYTGVAAKPPAEPEASPPAVAVAAAAAKAPVETKSEPVEAEGSSKKASRGTIRGQSVSSVSLDAVAGASRTALKSEVVTSNVVVGQEYEQIQVVTKGVAVQIIRPAASPDKGGPKVRSPKERSGNILKTDSGWYDADADVLVLVRARKKASSQKALVAILKR